jgi:hypothetical protein
MAAGFPVKADYATGDVLSAANMNDLAGTLNYLDPTAKGDLFPASSGTALTRLAVGANDTVLTADSTTATGLKWAAASGGGAAVKQFLSNNSTTTQTVSTTSYVDVTNATITITPTSASSNVQISITFPIEMQRQTNALIGFTVQLLRGATVLDEWDNIVMLNAGVAANAFIQSTGMVAINYKDSPATTSATTYKLQAKLNTTGNLATSFLPGANGTLNISAMEF